MIINITLTGHSGSFTLDERSVTLEWLVFSDELNEFSAAIASQGKTASGANLVQNGKAAGWAPPGGIYVFGGEWDTRMFAQSVEVSDRTIIQGTGSYEIAAEDGEPVLIPLTPEGIVRWKVTQKFSSKAQEESGDEPSAGNKVTIGMSTELESEPFVRDVMSGNLVLNSAGQFFNPPPEKSRKVPAYNIVRKEIPNPLMKAKQYSNVVNSDTFYGAPVGTLLMNITCSYDGEWWTVTYEIKERADGWQTYLLDTGYEEIRDGKMIKILNDGDGTPVSEPAKLDGNGQKLADQNQEGVDVGPLWKYHGLPFGVLNLPDIFSIVSH